MVQDTLTHAAPPLPLDQVQVASEATATETTPRPQQPAAAPQAPGIDVPADTAKVNPADVLPLPENLPLTMKPAIFDSDYWADGIVHIDKRPFVVSLDKATGHTSTVEIVEPTGIAGDPIPYRFRTDNIVTIILLASFFLIVWVISRSRYFISEQLKDFFSQRQRQSLFAERTQNELRGQLFLIFQTCFIIGLLFFDYTQEKQAEVFHRVSPYQILGLSVGLCCLYYLVKIGFYHIVNTVFFTRNQRIRWNATYLLSILALGPALLPVALLMVYFDLSFDALFILTLCILVVDKTLLFYKCSRTFFNYTLGWMHLFLYFCTLEIMPMLIQFRIMVFANRFLLTIN